MFDDWFDQDDLDKDDIMDDYCPDCGRVLETLGYCDSCGWEEEIDDDNEAISADDPDGD